MLIGKFQRGCWSDLAFFGTEAGSCFPLFQVFMLLAVGWSDMRVELIFSSTLHQKANEPVSQNVRIPF